MVDGTFVLPAARQLDQTAAGQFDVDKQQRTDGDDEQWPEQTVNGVGLSVDLLGDGVIQRIGVVETAE